MSIWIVYFEPRGSNVSVFYVYTFNDHFSYVVPLLVTKMSHKHWFFNRIGGFDHLSNISSKVMTHSDLDSSPKEDSYTKPNTMTRLVCLLFKKFLLLYGCSYEKWLQKMFL